MIRMKEYILLSILSYCNFGEVEYGKTLKEIFENSQNNRIILETFSILLSKNRELFMNYFSDILEEWKIYYIDNRTSQSIGERSSGFYAVVFKKEEKYVVSYRGSEKYPLEDAYKDFIETDLAIGLGKIPLQFYEGVEVYYHLIENCKLDPKNVYLTGHSLGGGIAQYVALTIDKFFSYIPYTYTWNAVGINRDGIVSIMDYIRLDEILKEYTNLSKKEIENFKEFEETYLEFLSKELRKIRAIKDNKTALVDKYDTVYFNIDEDFVKQLIKSTTIEKCLMKFSLSRRRDLILKQNLFEKIFQLDNMGELLERAQKFIIRVKNNKVYEEKVYNFGHSQDLTFSLFRHLGTTYLVDEGFVKSKKQKVSIFNNFKIFTKSIQSHHFEDVFFPFIRTEGEKAGNFSINLNLDFMASSLRKLFTMEYCLERKLLAYYFSLEKIDEYNFVEIKQYVISGLNNSGINLLYKKQIIKQLMIMNKEEFSELWEKIKKKLPSPYKNMDIFDTFIFI
ncbi:hypothetical protein [Fusobacterium sp.]|uniref:hypothetical protein n=1 Tax=Fusobacterium sp. TaxID=68766 RepID=UPI0025BA04EC|nr:hypothetical protein [Fusobacterium sp.]